MKLQQQMGEMRKTHRVMRMNGQMTTVLILMILMIWYAVGILFSVFKNDNNCTAQLGITANGNKSWLCRCLPFCMVSVGITVMYLRLQTLCTKYCIK
jgi:hypothetical protein